MTALLQASDHLYRPIEEFKTNIYIDQIPIFSGNPQNPGNYFIELNKTHPLDKHT